PPASLPSTPLFRSQAGGARARPAVAVGHDQRWPVLRASTPYLGARRARLCLGCVHEWRRLERRGAQRGRIGEWWKRRVWQGTDPLVHADLPAEGGLGGGQARLRLEQVQLGGAQVHRGREGVGAGG